MLPFWNGAPIMKVNANILEFLAYVVCIVVFPMILFRAMGGRGLVIGELIGVFAAILFKQWLTRQSAPAKKVDDLQERVEWLEKELHDRD